MNTSWDNLREFQGSLDRAFEELCAQYARHKATIHGWQFTRNGRPDGGLECFARRSDGSEIGWQAKWFRSAPGRPQWSQIADSLEGALRSYPKLNTFIVCLPLDRSSGDGTRVSQMDQWQSHVRRWTEMAQLQGRTIQFDYSGTSEIFEWLTQADEAGRLSFWFQRDFFTPKWFANRFDEETATEGIRRLRPLRSSNTEAKVAMLQAERAAALTKLTRYDDDQSAPLAAQDLLVVEPGLNRRSYPLHPLCAERIRNAEPTIWLSGRHFSPDIFWNHLVSRLGLISDRDRFLGALNAAGEARRVRAIIAIDAIHQSANQELWAKTISGVRLALEPFPFVTVAFSVLERHEDDLLFQPDSDPLDIPRVPPRDSNDSWSLRIQRILGGITQYSTPQSRTHRRISILALVETVVAIIVALTIGSHFTPLVFAISCLAVPAMLLRSPESVAHLYVRFKAEFDPQWATSRRLIRDAYQSPVAVRLSAWKAIIFTLKILWVRLATLCQDVRRFPMDAFLAIPDNWRRYVLSIDLVAPPEIVPEIDSLGYPYYIVTFWHTARRGARLFRHSKSTTARALILIWATIYFPVAFIPALIFRWSIKATVLIWWGLLIGGARFRSRVFRQTQTTLSGDLKFYCTDPFAIFGVCVAATVVIVIASKAMGYTVVTISSRPSNDFAFLLLTRLIEPKHVPPWQWFALAYSVLAICYYIMCWHLYVLWQATGPRHIRFASNLYRWGPVPITLLGSYPTLACLYILFSCVKPNWFPPLDAHWLP